MRILTWIVVIVVGSSGLAACSSAGRLTPAEQAVYAMYQAIDSGDKDAYMDTLLPANRRVLNPLTLLTYLSFNWGPISIMPGSMMQTTIPEVKVTELANDGQAALVQAEGVIRLPAFTFETRFCEQWDVRQDGGAWYVDLYAPQRQQRLARRLAEPRPLADAPGLGQSNDEFALLLELMQLAGEIAALGFDTCVDNP